MSDPQRFDVAVFAYPKDPAKTFVQRIVGIPGDTLEVRGKVVWVNGTPLEEPYARFTARTGEHTLSFRSFGPLQIPAGYYFVLGDNRDQSSDSRIWGTVPRENLMGRARVIYFSWGSSPSTIRRDRLGRPLG